MHPRAVFSSWASAPSILELVWLGGVLAGLVFGTLPSALTTRNVPQAARARVPRSSSLRRGRTAL